MNPIFKEHLISGAKTFAATFIVAAAAFLSSGIPIEWTHTFWASVLLAGVRAAIKEIIERFAPAALGGRK